MMMVNELVTRLEAHNKTLDEMSFMDSSTTNRDTKFVSAIRFHGVPILPPVITKKRRDEIQAIRQQARNVEERIRQHRNTSRKSTNSPSPYHNTVATMPHNATETAPLPLSNSRFHSGDGIGLRESSDAMLDSLTRDLASLDEVTLPTEYSGFPLTSTRQQHISQVLGKLSQTLNIPDSLTGTGSTEASGSTLSGLKELPSECLPEITDESIHITADNLEKMNYSNLPSHSLQNQNKSDIGDIDFSANLSDLYTESTDRNYSTDVKNTLFSSPKSPKSTVHFASRLTEFHSNGPHFKSVRSPDGVAKSRPNDLTGLPNYIPDETVKKTSDNSSYHSEPFKIRPANVNSLLSKVVLSPDIDSSISDLTSHGVPFQGYVDDDEETYEKQLFVASSTEEQSPRISTDNILDVGKNVVAKESDSTVVETKLISSPTSNSQNLTNVTASVTLPPTPPSQPGTFRKKGHSRQGSYTLEHPSPALLKSAKDVSTKENVIDVSQNYKRSNFNEEKLAGGVAMSLEAEGKEDHINRYLDYVRQYAMNDSLNSTDSHESVIEKQTQVKGMDVYSESFAQSLLPDDWNKMTHLSQEDIFQLQSDHFETLRKDLMEQQKNQLDQLFHQQQEEQLLLQKDIEQRAAALETVRSPNCNQESGSQERSDKNQRVTNQNCEALANNIPVKPMNVMVKTKSKSADKRPKSSHQFTTSTTVQLTRPKALPTSYLKSSNQTQQIQKQQKQQENILDCNVLSPTNFVKSTVSSVCINSMNILPDNRPGTPDSEETYEKQPLTGTYSYISSPTLMANPKDVDTSMISTLGKDTPKQKLFHNASPSPKTSVFQKKLVQRSPFQKPRSPHQFTLKVPINAYDDGMKPKFDRLTAIAKGFLTRRLIETDKVQDLIKTIRDTRDFAINFQSETVQRVGGLTSQDRDLLERIIAQLQAALLDVHEIFFVSSIQEQMALIAHSREVNAERVYRKSISGSLEVRKVEKRMSTATYKAMERKRLAQTSTETVITTRPKSAPPQTNTVSQDRSLRYSRGSTKVTSEDVSSSRSRMERPKTATSRSQTNRETVGQSSKHSAKMIAKNKLKTSKAWR